MIPNFTYVLLKSRKKYDKYISHFNTITCSFGFPVFWLRNKQPDFQMDANEAN